jgi:hypothetical protein
VPPLFKTLKPPDGHSAQAAMGVFRFDRRNTPS